MPNKFDVEHFELYLQTSWLGREFVYIEKIDSTNTYLKKVPSSELVHGTVVLADYQEKGRGQYERKWEAEPYKNLTFTIAFRPKSSLGLNLLALSVAFSISKTLERYINEPVNLKWPNDIIVGDKKIGGLLTECIFNGSKPERVLIGLGLNIDQAYFSSDVENTATSFRKVSDASIAREDLLNEILLEIENEYHRWHNHEESLVKEVSQKVIGYGEWVKVSIDGEIQDQKYKCIGVNSNGELMMLNEQLDVNKFVHEQIRIITGYQGIQTPKKSPSL